MSAPYYSDDRVTLYHGDCLDVLATLPDASVDSIVTDPPYGLGFMGKAWDDLPPGEDWARECLRVLKPGGHLLAFGGTRTWHRLACAVEDAGFEVRDSIAWLYGSGFPKSLDVSKAIDKAGPPGQAPFAEFAAHYEEQRKAKGLTHAKVCAHGGWHGTVNHGGSSVNWANGYGMPTVDQWAVLQPLLDLDERWSERVQRIQYEREVLGIKPGTRLAVAPGQNNDRSRTGLAVTAAGSDHAETWAGWGTALKPAFEPVVVARKPLIGTVAANVLAHGTGALNVDGCRIEHDGGVNLNSEQRQSSETAGFGSSGMKAGHVQPLYAPGGRWPANVVLDESQAETLDEQSGTLTSGANPTRRGSDKFRDAYGDFAGQETCDAARGADTGGASRFFYVAKADASERPRVNGTAHPTVKPLNLMRWLVRLVTPPGGTVLEPFAGSGTTVEACILEGFRCIAIEKGDEYLPLITQRIHRQRNPVEAIRQTGGELGLFELGGEGA